MEDDKVVIRFRAAGSAPILKKNKFKVKGSDRFESIMQFLRKQLKFDESDSLFIYVNQAFAPALDDTVRNLYKVDEKLEITYCTTAAWG